MLNSLLVPFLNAAADLLVRGVADPETIDTTWRIATGAPLGPFQIYDVIGLRTPYAIASANAARRPAGRRLRRVPEDEYLDQGKLGARVGRGLLHVSRARSGASRQDRPRRAWWEPRAATRLTPSEEVRRERRVSRSSRSTSPRTSTSSSGRRTSSRPSRTCTRRWSASARSCGSASRSARPRAPRLVRRPATTARWSTCGRRTRWRSAPATASSSCCASGSRSTC